MTLSAWTRRNIKLRHQCNYGLLLLGNFKVTCYWLCKVDFLVLLVCLGALENLFDFDGTGFISLNPSYLGGGGRNMAGADSIQDWPQLLVSSYLTVKSEVKTGFMDP